jgi:hypothetical protein
MVIAMHGSGKVLARARTFHYIGVMQFTKGLFLSASAFLILAGTARAATLDYQMVVQRAEEWQPKPSEKIFDQIGWAEDIRAGLRLAKEHRRPLFLFTHDGRMNLGRC